MSARNVTRFISKAAVTPFRAQSYLGAFEWILRSATHASTKPQLFIIGAPRSGTTLISQYIIHRLRVAYFTNGVGHFPSAPCITTLAQRLLHGEYSSDFYSEYGKIRGPLAPREAGGFWNRFFDPEEYLAENPLSRERTERLRKSIACVQRAFGDLPFVNKNVKHLLRLNILASIFPNSTFLVVERDLPDAALSMLRARQRLFNNPNQWFSIRPPDYSALVGLSPAEQILGQYRSLTKKMELDLQALPPSRHMRISYSEFCQNPDCLIHRIIERLGIVEYRNPPIESFPAIRNRPETDEEIELVRMANSA